MTRASNLRFGADADTGVDAPVASGGVSGDAPGTTARAVIGAASAIASGNAAATPTASTPFTVVVTRPAGQSDALDAQLAARGVRTVDFPLLTIEPVRDDAPLRAALSALARYALVVFVSPNAVERAFACHAAASGPLVWPRALPVAVVGPASVAALARQGVRAPDWTVISPADVDVSGDASASGKTHGKASKTAGMKPDANATAAEKPATSETGEPSPRFDSEALYAAIQAFFAAHAGVCDTSSWRDGRALAGQRVLIVRGDGGREWLADRLREAGAEVHALAAYRRGAPVPSDAAWARVDALPARAHAWLVTSSEGVRNLDALARARLNADALARLRRAAFVAPHPRIAETARALGFDNVSVSGAGDARIVQALLALAAQAGFASLAGFTGGEGGIDSYADARPAPAGPASPPTPPAPAVQPAPQTPQARESHGSRALHEPQPASPIPSVPRAPDSAPDQAFSPASSPAPERAGAYTGTDAPGTHIDIDAQPGAQASSRTTQAAQRLTRQATQAHQTTRSTAIQPPQPERPAQQAAQPAISPAIQPSAQPRMTDSTPTHNASGQASTQAPQATQSAASSSSKDAGNAFAASQAARPSGGTGAAAESAHAASAAGSSGSASAPKTPGTPGAAKTSGTSGTSGAPDAPGAPKSSGSAGSSSSSGMGGLPPAAYARRGHGLFMWLVVLVLIVAAGAGGYLLNRKVDRIDQRLVQRQQANAEQTAGLGERIDQATQTVHQSDARLAQLDARLSDAQAAQQALAQQYASLTQNRDDWTIAEVGQMLASASEQLQLTGNTQLALFALQSADARLAASDSAQAIAVRKAVARDIDKLKAAPSTDLTGLAIKLDTAISQIDTLPLAGEVLSVRGSGNAAANAAPNASAVSAASATSAAAIAAAPASAASGATAQPTAAAQQPASAATPAAAAARAHASPHARPPARAAAASAPASHNAAPDNASPRWKVWLDDVVSGIGQQLKSLVQVRRLDNADAMLISPDQGYFLRENLKLRLLSARLSLLSRNDATLKTDLHAADAALARYFDNSSKSTQAVRDLVRQVLDGSGAVALPNLNDSLQAIQQYRSRG